jgi:hypothetical protein
VLVRLAALEAGHIADWFGTPVTTPAHTIVDLARHHRADGLLAADAALHESLTTVPDLDVVIARCRTATNCGGRSAGTCASPASATTSSG